MIDNIIEQVTELVMKEHTDPFSENQRIVVKCAMKQVLSSYSIQPKQQKKEASPIKTRNTSNPFCQPNQSKGVPPKLSIII